jgi:arylsulfatase A-like enzyme
MCRTKEYKYVYRLYEKHELYDLKKDPWEHFNVIDNPEYSVVLAALEKRMLQFFVETGDVVPFKHDVREVKNPHQ